ncbi:TetR/AcrR family transcriptional regulator [Saccharospirillum salsuginis]|uniref:TetR family transcriptional regulator n=1 Tax=Saccharospirillum salsuginis TaxID=418750 RepID=A0A918NJN4_9GAMM|nr:TetR/AcrR family transcriptional regulator [Saccharospirillum salsuginis]GGX72480.1 TetR family transcriptional regulator [Saccharospirillum salsuginis]
MSNTREQLTDRAEDYIRSGGFSSFSFRDLAKDLGIKSASVHYHFPTKSDLGTAVADRYNQRFKDALPDPETSNRFTEELIRHYIRMFHTEMMQAEKICLCAVLSVERATLSDDMRASLETFYTLNLDWLTRVFTRQAPDAALPRTQAYQRACQVLSALQGALIGAWAMQDRSYFEKSARGLYKDLFGKTLKLPKHI